MAGSFFALSPASRYSPFSGDQTTQVTYLLHACGLYGLGACGSCAVDQIGKVLALVAFL